MTIQLTPEEINLLTESITKINNLCDRSRGISDAIGITTAKRATMSRIAAKIQIQAQGQIYQSKINTQT